MPNLLAIDRQINRAKLGVESKRLPFFGYDQWNHYEISWLNAKGKPLTALGEITYSCESPKLIESKSMKLYFHTFNNQKFADIESLRLKIQNDLSSSAETDVTVQIIPTKTTMESKLHRGFTGVCLDDLDIECKVYQVDADLLKLENNIVEETLYSDLLKSNCPLTNQPDWGSIQIIYKGQKINHENLLKYIVSFREHNEYHEQCIERMFMDIMRQCKPTELTIRGRYTRRGGLDINPCRSTHPIKIMENIRLCRQ